MNKRSISLLVVDDDDDFRGTMVARFDRIGFQVDGAPSGEGALGAAQQRAYDVAIFDMMMPGMSGLELLEAFRKSHSECEVIMLTGQGSIESAVQAMKMGAFDFVTKPFPLKDLEALIERAFERRSLRKENEQLKVLVERAQPNREMVGQSPAILVEHFVGPEWQVSPEALDVMETYNWPGNVRQLINVIERGKILATDDIIQLHDLPRELRESDLSPNGHLDSDDLSTIERTKVVEILRREGGNKTRAAQTLGIERRKIYRLIEKYGISDHEITTRAN